MFQRLSDPCLGAGIRPEQPHTLGEAGLSVETPAGLVRLQRPERHSRNGALHSAAHLHAVVHQPALRSVVLRHHPRGGDRHHLCHLQPHHCLPQRLRPFQLPDRQARSFLRLPPDARFAAGQLPAGFSGEGHPRPALPLPAIQHRRGLVGATLRRMVDAGGTGQGTSDGLRNAERQQGAAKTNTIVDENLYR